MLLEPVTIQSGPRLQSFRMFCTAGNVTEAPPLTVTLPPLKLVTAGKLMLVPLTASTVRLVSALKLAATLERLSA